MPLTSWVPRPWVLREVRIVVWSLPLHRCERVARSSRRTSLNTRWLRRRWLVRRLLALRHRQAPLVGRCHRLPTFIRRQRWRQWSLRYGTRTLSGNGRMMVCRLWRMRIVATCRSLRQCRPPLRRPRRLSLRFITCRRTLVWADRIRLSLPWGLAIPSSLLRIRPKEWVARWRRRPWSVVRRSPLVTQWQIRVMCHLPLAEKVSRGCGHRGDLVSPPL